MEDIENNVSDDCKAQTEQKNSMSGILLHVTAPTKKGQ